ncbi:10668_t:CDS:2 [Funneliformis mosseae]|uniref:10668_t:CDS:1 n=1 Tax=Funneliformis mosseae TaxID=27381 RepID=A0A9N8V8B3_FUNMO|nr:10668_t:CDS:2 [Funneliformis mosseae]
MDIDEPTSSNNSNDSDDEYDEEVSYIVIDLGTEVTLDMITNNFEILNNINPSSFNFNQNRHHQNQDSSSTSILTSQPSNTNNKTSNPTVLAPSSKSFHHHIKPSTTIHEKEVETSNSINKNENNDIDYSLISNLWDNTSECGLDTDTPYLRIGGIHFKGDYDETIGTDLIFFPEPDPMNSRQQKLTYQCLTTKKIKFSQVNLQEIDLNTTNELNIEDDDNEWEDNYSLNNKLDLFNIKSDLEDDEEEDDD